MKFSKLVFCIIIFLTANSSAREFQFGLVRSLNVRASDGAVWFEVMGLTNDAPEACDLFAKQNRFVIKDPASVAGKLQISLLTLAKSLNRRISVVGLKSCHLDAEIASIITLGDS